MERTRRRLQECLALVLVRNPKKLNGEDGSIDDVKLGGRLRIDLFTPASPVATYYLHESRSNRPLYQHGRAQSVPFRQTR